jgi:transcriptional regulator with XRE-family HTH domain
MQISHEIQEIQNRGSALHLSLTKVARLAQVNPSTALRILRGDTPDARVSSIEKLKGALDAKERETLKHLLERFGRPELYEQIIPPTPSADASRTTLDDASGREAA